MYTCILVTLLWLIVGTNATCVQYALVCPKDPPYCSLLDANGNFETTSMRNNYCLDGRIHQKNDTLYCSTRSAIQSISLDAMSNPNASSVDTLYLIELNWQSAYHLDYSTSMNYLFFSLYTSDSEHEGWKIMRIDLPSGGNAMVLFEADNKGPKLRCYSVPLAVDNAHNRLYYFDPMQKGIFSSDFDGNDKKLFTSTEYSCSFGMAIDDSGQHLVYDAYTHITGCRIDAGESSCETVIRMEYAQYITTLRILKNNIYYVRHTDGAQYYHIQRANLDGSFLTALGKTDSYLSWIGIFPCIEVIPIDSSSSVTKPSTHKALFIGLIVGGSILTLVTVFVIMAAVCWRKKLLHRKKRSSVEAPDNEDIDQSHTSLLKRKHIK